jgi:hypothetical protein
VALSDSRPNHPLSSLLLTRSSLVQVFLKISVRAATAFQFHSRSWHSGPDFLRRDRSLPVLRYSFRSRASSVRCPTGLGSLASGHLRRLHTPRSPETSWIPPCRDSRSLLPYQRVRLPLGFNQFLGSTYVSQTPLHQRLALPTTAISICESPPGKSPSGDADCC